MRLAGKTAIVTGGASGFGAGIARKFATEGAQVMLADLNIEMANELAAELGKNVKTVQANVAQDRSVAGMVAATLKAFGKIDILINNAGVSWGAPIDGFPEIGWDKVFDTNVKGVFFLTQKLLPQLRASASSQDPARVINIGSIDGLKNPAFETFSYGSSKAAVHHLTRSLALHLTKENIICNAIAPGPFPTWMLSTGVGGGGDTDIDWGIVAKSNPRGRVGTPEDIAGLAIFLSSRAGAYIVGETIACDGGSAYAT